MTLTAMATTTARTQCWMSMAILWSPVEGRLLVEQVVVQELELELGLELGLELELLHLHSPPTALPTTANHTSFAAPCVPALHAACQGPSFCTRSHRAAAGDAHSRQCPPARWLQTR